MFVIQISDEENYEGWVTVSLSYLHFPLITTVILNTPTILNHSKEKQACTFTMNPWTFPELVAGFVSNTPLPLIPTNAQFIRLSLRDEYRSHTLTATNVVDVSQAQYRYGKVPRTVYRAVSQGGVLVKLDEKTASKISTISRSTIQRLLAAPADARDPKISHKLVCVYRRPHEDNVPSQRDYTDILSPFVAALLLDADNFASIDEKRSLIALFAGIPEVSVTRGWLYEEYMHRCLSQVYALPLVSRQLVPMKAGGQTYKVAKGQLPHTPCPVIKRSVRRYNAAPGLTTPSSPALETYNIPVIKNNPCFDSYVETETEAFVLQITVSDVHDVDSKTGKGLSLLKKLLPENKPWHYVLVVPREKLETVRLTSVSTAWAECIKSFQVMSEDELWKNEISPSSSMEISKASAENESMSD